MKADSIIPWSAGSVIIGAILIPAVRLITTHPGDYVVPETVDIRAHLTGRWAMFARRFCFPTAAWSYRSKTASCIRWYDNRGGCLEYSDVAQADSGVWIRGRLPASDS